MEPGSLAQELVRINEDAKVNPQLPGFNGATHNANAVNTRRHMASLPPTRRELLGWNTGTDQTECAYYTFTRACICAHTRGRDC